MAAGYAVIVLLTSVGFNVWLEGKDLFALGAVGMAQGVLVATVAGLAGGYLAGWIGRKHPLKHAALVLIPLAIDTAYVLFWFDGTAPLWFDAMGSATLMAFTLIGGAIRRLQLRSFSDNVGVRDDVH